MSKIFRYECRRLLWNKFFIGLAVVMLLYGALVLHAVTILGYPTPPPSPPGALGTISPRMLPLLWIGIAVLSDLLYLAQGPAGGSPHGRYADAAQAVRFGPVPPRP